MQVQAPPAPSVRWRPPPASHAPTALQHPCINAFQHPLSSRRRRLLQCALPTIRARARALAHPSTTARKGCGVADTNEAGTNPPGAELAPREHCERCRRRRTPPSPTPDDSPTGGARKTPGTGPFAGNDKTTARSSVFAPLRPSAQDDRSPFAASVAAPSVPPNAAPSTTTIASTRPTSTTAAGPFAAPAKPVGVAAATPAGGW